METQTVTTSFTQEELFPYETDHGDSDRKTHIVSPPENKHLYQIGMSATDIVQAARMAEIEVVTLCGKKFIPKRDPERYPACEQCIAIATEYMSKAGE